MKTFSAERDTRQYFDYQFASGNIQSKMFCFFSIRSLAQRFRMVWRQHPFRVQRRNVYANNGRLLIVELGLTYDKILQNMRVEIANFYLEQIYTEVSD